MYDAVHVFAMALNQLDQSQASKNMLNQSQYWHFNTVYRWLQQGLLAAQEKKHGTMATLSSTTWKWYENDIIRYNQAKLVE